MHLLNFDSLIYFSNTSQIFLYSKLFFFFQFNNQDRGLLKGHIEPAILNKAAFDVEEYKSLWRDIDNPRGKS